MLNETTTARHARQIMEGDGVSDDTAVAWSDLEDANRRAGTHGKHSAQ